MPIRHPDGISTPAASPASSSVWSPGVSRTVADLSEGDCAAFTGGDDGGPEPFGVQALGYAVVIPVLLECVEHAGRSACPRLALGEVADQIAEFGGAEHAVGVSVLLDQADSALAASMRSSPAKITSSGVGALCTTTTSSTCSAMLRSMPITGVMPLPAVRNKIFGRRRGGEREFSCGVVELDDGADGGASHQVVGDLAAGDRFDRDCDAAVGPVGAGGQGVRAPLTHAVDVDTDADVLPGRVGAPAAARLDDQADGVAGFGVDCDDPAAQVRA